MYISKNLQEKLIHDLTNRLNAEFEFKYSIVYHPYNNLDYSVKYGRWEKVYKNW